MKARLVPVIFQTGGDADFDNQLLNLKILLAGEADVLDPVSLGEPMPKAEAALFPQLDNRLRITRLERSKMQRRRNALDGDRGHIGTIVHPLSMSNGV